ncbi:LOW QUALITY PROTEIN: hypothetical protein Cgig2_020984 [Carnegiea gigantea]|uniref:Uncharacterized protein n=1 Tax=Carnegiea gigantea TaxID=171969 RepID=A0A9Q1Q669_9CARY|nr:LOW QUALITY PROTEIN: hypothetical protein Cgig2_020984 [Carnegiea gigantea]
MISDMEEEVVETTEENIFDSRVLINVNPSFVTMPYNFKDDKEGKFLLPNGVQVKQKILKSVEERVRGFKYSLRCKYVKEDTTKEVSHNLDKSKRPLIRIKKDLTMNRSLRNLWHVHLYIYHNLHKKGTSEAVFFEATAPAETFAYHQLMGHASIRGGVGPKVTSNQLNAKRNSQSGTEPSNSSIVSLLLKEGDDVEDNQRNNTTLAGEHIRDTLATMPALAKNNEAYIKDAGVNKSCITQLGKKHINVTNRMENSATRMTQPHYFVNQTDDQNTSMGENTNTSSCSKQLNNAWRLNFDQREQGFSLISMPSPLSRELMCSRVINPYATTQVHVCFS